MCPRLLTSQHTRARSTYRAASGLDYLATSSVPAPQVRRHPLVPRAGAADGVRRVRRARGHLGAGCVVDRRSGAVQSRDVVVDSSAAAAAEPSRWCPCLTHVLPRVAGCIFAELLGRKPLFKGHSTREQLELIISKLGTPTPGA